MSENLMWKSSLVSPGMVGVNKTSSLMLWNGPISPSLTWKEKKLLSWYLVEAGNHCNTGATEKAACCSMKHNVLNLNIKTRQKSELLIAWWMISLLRHHPSASQCECIIHYSSNQAEGMQTHVAHNNREERLDAPLDPHYRDVMNPEQIHSFTWVTRLKQHHY